MGSKFLFFIGICGFPTWLFAQLTPQPTPQKSAQHIELENKLNAVGGQEGIELRYGYAVFTKTSEYFGPTGSVTPSTVSHMSCSNCHLDAGSKISGNSLLDTHALYPQYRSREGEIQTLTERINACFQHPLLATKIIPPGSREMKTMLMYFRWLGQHRTIPVRDQDDRLIKLAPSKTAANLTDGENIYKQKCTQCHGVDGAGQISADKKNYAYPPLWGKESFMTGSSMSRLSILTRFIYANMPWGTEPGKPTLTEQEAWNVAAFVLQQPRPAWRGKVPFPNIKEKPFDYPIGPYADPFSVEQHRRGPLAPIFDFYGAPTASSTSVGI